VAPPSLPRPNGKAHGSTGVCLTNGGSAVLVSPDGESWGLPGGRPEGDEDWRATLDREVLEEACASVDQATLLGFSKGECKGGPENGLIIVRSIWLAFVSLHTWEPQHEIISRRLVPFHMAQEELTPNQVPQPITERVFHEASAVANQEDNPW